MIFLRYILYCATAMAVTVSALFPINLLAPLFMDAAGNLPRWFVWYQPSDNPAWGDKLWRDEHPHYSDYMLAVSYLYRNPAQGFDQYLKAAVGMNSMCDVRGDININDADGIAGWYLITTNGYFQFAYVWNYISGKCLQGCFGWRLSNIVKKYEHKTMGQFVFTPVRGGDFKGE